MGGEPSGGLAAVRDLSLASVLQALAHAASSKKSWQRRAASEVLKRCCRGAPGSAASRCSRVLVHLALGALYTPDSARQSHTTHACSRAYVSKVSVQVAAQATLHVSPHTGGRSTRARKRRELRHGCR